jgi:uncharacterized damage-inducible protein DinB
MSEPEAWMRGPIEGVNALVAPLLYSFQQAREDLARFGGDLTTEQVWSRYGDLNSFGREVRHIAGSVDRLTTYLQGRQLNEKQMEDLRAESVPGASAKELFSTLDVAFLRTEAVVRNLDVRILTEPREVGRKRLPTTAIGLLYHMAEHTQRHVGQAIVAAKLAQRHQGTEA